MAAFQGKQNQTWPSGYLLIVAVVTTKHPTSTRSFSVSCKIAQFHRRASLTVTLLLSCQTDVMHQSVFEMIHTEDQQEFRRNLHWGAHPSVDTGPTAQPHTGMTTETDPDVVLHWDPEVITHPKSKRELKVCFLVVVFFSSEVGNKVRKGEPAE